MKYRNKFKDDYNTRHLNGRVQILKVSHSISVGRMVYWCFVEKFDLNDHSIYISYKDRNGLNVRPDNLIRLDLSALQQLIMKAGRKDLHFGHSAKNQALFSEKGRLLNIKTVSQYNMEGDRINTFTSITEASTQTNINLQAISSVCNKRSLSAGGFVWRHGKALKIPVKRINKLIRSSKGEMVSQYDLNGKFLNSYLNITAAARAVGLKRESIRAAVHGKTLVSGGFIWRKQEAEQIDIARTARSLSLRRGYTISQYNTNGIKLQTFYSAKEASKTIGAPVEQVTAMAIRDDLLLKGTVIRYGDQANLTESELLTILESIKKPYTRVVTQYDLKGKRIAVYPSPTDASKYTGVPIGAITGSANGNKTTGKGFIWRRGDGATNILIPDTPIPIGKRLAKKVRQYQMTGQFIKTYPTLSDAARATGTSISGIAAVLRGDTKSSGGFKWKVS